MADLSLSHISALLAAFPLPDFYLSEQAVRDAIARRRQFNMPHIPSGLKVDIFLPPASDFGRSEMGRGRRLSSEGKFSAWFGSPEDVLLNKLV